MNAALLFVLAAQTYQLTGDALVLARAPGGVIAIGGDATLADWVSAEALIWAGSRQSPEANALVAALHLRHPNGWAELDAGRLIVAGGALRPVHLDGVRGAARAVFGAQLEAFGGVPVDPMLSDRGGDWLGGLRVSQKISGWAVVGVSAYQRTDEGVLSDREVGFDFAMTPFDTSGLYGRLSYDLMEVGLSELAVGADHRISIVTLDAFFTRRSPARILPATSLFSVLGDVPSSRAGARALFAVAPRLDLSAQVGVRDVDGLGEEVVLRATLRLDDRGRGAVALEARRDGTPDAGWFGVRAIARVPFAQFTASTEVEVVVPDDDTRGSLWPWALIALGWQPLPDWELAAAFEGSASPEHEIAVDGLFRATYRWQR